MGIAKEKHSSLLLHITDYIQTHDYRLNIHNYKIKNRPAAIKPKSVFPEPNF